MKFIFSKRTKLILALILALLLIAAGVFGYLVKTGKIKIGADTAYTCNTSVTLNPEREYFTGETVTLTLANKSRCNITLQNSAPWRILDSKNQTVYQPISMPVLTVLKGGLSKNWTWDQKSASKQVLTGNYKIILDYTLNKKPYQVFGNLVIKDRPFESFETGFGGWEADYYLTCEHDPIPCWPLEWKIDRSISQASDGKYSLSYFLNGDRDSGQIWVEKSFQVPVKQEVKVEVSFDLWSPEQSDMNQWDTVGYIGQDNPNKWGSDWIRSGKTDQVAGWKTYTFDRTITASSNLWVGVGIGVSWETSRTYYIDKVAVKISQPTSIN